MILMISWIAPRVFQHIVQTRIQMIGIALHRGGSAFIPRYLQVMNVQPTVPPSPHQMNYCGLIRNRSRMAMGLLTQHLILRIHLFLRKAEQ